MRNYPSWGPPQRNGNWKLDNPRPVETYDDPVHCDRVAECGFEVMSKADPDRAGDPPAVRGTDAALRRNFDRSFEQ